MKIITNISTLPCGLRLVYRKETTEVEYFGAAINAGSRDDPDGCFGLAHFVEHVLFKGTRRRKSWHIVNRMETCGGELNAYTTKETTVVYTLFPRGNFQRAAELIGDLLCHSTFPSNELDKEREVVADEIDQYRDIPSETVYDDFEDLIFSGSALGHNILGTTDSLRSFNTETCRKYVEQNFTAGRMVIFYCGNKPFDSVAKAVEKYFADLPSGQGTINRVPPVNVAPFDESVNLGNHQANTVMGIRTVSLNSPERTAVALLSNILGGPGMNSLLNLELRERRGLVYSVETATSLLSDTGLLTIYFGCDHADVDRCRQLVNRTISRIADGAVITPRFLAMAKRQYLGQLTVASDIRENSVMSMARAALYYGRIITRDETTEHINEISANTLRDLAASIISQGLSNLTLF